MSCHVMLRHVLSCHFKLSQVNRAASRSALGWALGPYWAIIGAHTRVLNIWLVMCFVCILCIRMLCVLYADARGSPNDPAPRDPKTCLASKHEKLQPASLATQMQCWPPCMSDTLAHASHHVHDAESCEGKCMASHTWRRPQPHKRKADHDMGPCRTAAAPRRKMPR